MSHRLPPCDHDECGPTECKRSGSLAPAPAAIRDAETDSLLREMMRKHADPADSEYNMCDGAPCMWCVRVKKIIGPNDIRS